MRELYPEKVFPLSALVLQNYDIEKIITPKKISVIIPMTLPGSGKTTIT
jgi:hypothetical protein